MIKLLAEPNDTHDLNCIQYNTNRSNSYRYINNDDDDDGASISTVSTNATADNIPGPGRIIDVFIYQYFGRKIERFANRFSMSRLPPARILQCLSVRLSIHYSVVHLGPISEHAKSLQRYTGGNILAGLKSLVKQTQ